MCWIRWCFNRTGYCSSLGACIIWCECWICDICCAVWVYCSSFICCCVINKYWIIYSWKSISNRIQSNSTTITCLIIIKFRINYVTSTININCTTTSYCSIIDESGIYNNSLISICKCNSTPISINIIINESRVNNSTITFTCCCIIKVYCSTITGTISIFHNNIFNSYIITFHNNCLFTIPVYNMAFTINYNIICRYSYTTSNSIILV